MKKAIEVLRKIESTSKRKEKEQLLKENDSIELRFLLETALNPYLTYGVKRISPISKGEVPTLQQLNSLRNKLTSRKITGNTAVLEIDSILGCSEPLIYKMLSRVFKKDLRIGIDTKTVNKIYGKDFIPEFKVGLCQKLEGKFPEDNWIMEPKLDGLRCIAIIDHTGEITFQSRNGKTLYNMDVIEKEIKDRGATGIVLDGELFADNWNSSISITHTQENHPDKDKLSYCIFDCIELENWNKQDTKVITDRKILLTAFFFIKEKFKHLQMVQGIAVTDTNRQIVKDILQRYLDEGYEGAVLKKLGSKYPFKRSKAWLKWKPVYTEDIEIIGYEEGTGRNKGTLGAFVCNYKGKEVKVGSGFDDKQREEFWKNKEEMIGETIEIEYQEITKDGSLRFPIFKRWRKDK